jgi:hypothetical protein
VISIETSNGLILLGKFLSIVVIDARVAMHPQNDTIPSRNIMKIELDALI